MTMLDDFDDRAFPASFDLAIRDDVRRAGAEVYAGFDFPEADAFIQKLEDRGLRIIRQ